MTALWIAAEIPRSRASYFLTHAVANPFNIYDFKKLYLSQCVTALHAKLHFLLINILHIRTRSHNTGWIMAMDKVEGMAQLVDNFFIKVKKFKNVTENGLSPLIGPSVIIEIEYYYSIDWIF